MHKRSMIVLSYAAVIIIGCSGNSAVHESSVPSTIEPESLVLYSIDGQHLDPEDGPDYSSHEKFHHHPVLGKIKIEDAAKRGELMVALKEGIVGGDGTVYKCFNPRHALQTVENGKTIDYVICFECLQVKVYQDDKENTESTTDDPQPVFNAALVAAGILLAPQQ